MNEQINEQTTDGLKPEPAPPFFCRETYRFWAEVLEVAHTACIACEPLPYGVEQTLLALSAMRDPDLGPEFHALWVQFKTLVGYLYELDQTQLHTAKPSFNEMLDNVKQTLNNRPQWAR